ncbi:MAG: hypothetical protein HY836_13925 [Aquabacterium sp.]|uniref:type IV pilus assembly protein FimV n=1 Tax=Aquabacterium sp. TaxID=1872578 RepID=UPI0025BA0A2A|nr:hypothetical protein [Aquabacterium sp.]MBI5926684.1 hypothetical protein [Aquabacterium sp.]
MNNFKRVSAAVSAGMTLLCASGASYSLGFGQPSSRAILGDTLRVTVPLRLEAGEEIANECMAADVYFGDDKVSAKAVFTEVMPGANSEHAVLRVSTSALINEPVVTVYLAAGCKSRITRKIVALADPPTMSKLGYDAPSSSDVGEAVQAVSLPVSPTISQPGALPAVARATGPKRAGSHRAESAAPLASASSLMVKQVLASSETGFTPSTSSSSSSGKRTARKTAASMSKAVAAAKDDGARLLLDPVEADAMFVPELRMTSTMGAAAKTEDTSPDVLLRRQAAAALWLAMNATPEQLARDHQRLQDLEQRLAQLKQEGEKSRQVVAALQVRASKAEAAGGGVWLYGSGLLAFAGLALSGYLYNRLRQERKNQAAWWQAQSQLPEDSKDEARESALERTSAEFVRVPEDSWDADPADRTSSVAAGSAGLQQASPVTASNIHRHVPDAAPAGMAPPTPLIEPRAEPLREVSVEELIDLEQQAEFFVVLGQDDAAIDLLESHVHHTTGASPLPFLKLLEIYRRVGKRADYERVQAEFNERFNAYAPSWDADLQQGHSLADYPGVIDRLQALWSSPAKAMEVLERSLTRPDSSEDTFELPAYRELLFLYAVARDLSEREMVDRDSVDLLLPVADVSGVKPAEPVHHSSIIEPLMATRPIKAQPDARPSISLDLHLDDLQAPQVDHKP